MDQGLGAAPRSDDSLRRRRQIRLASEVEKTALRLFAERGYRNVTVEEIAAATDISPRTFFRYFPSKEDVVLAHQQRRAAKVRETLANRPPHEPATLAVRNAMMAFLPQDKEERASMILISKVLDEAPEVRARNAGYNMNMIDSLISMVAVRLGTDPTTDLRPRVTVSSMLAATSAALHMWLEGDGNGDIDSMVTQALDIVEEGFGGAAEERSRKSSLHTLASHSSSGSRYR